MTMRRRVRGRRDRMTAGSCRATNRARTPRANSITRRHHRRRLTFHPVSRRCPAESSTVPLRSRSPTTSSHVKPVCKHPCPCSRPPICRCLQIRGCSHRSYIFTETIANTTIVIINCSKNNARLLPNNETKFRQSRSITLLLTAMRSFKRSMRVGNGSTCFF